MKVHIRGFTLIELTIAVVVIGLLTASLIPIINNTVGRARDTQRKADLGQIRNGLEIFTSNNGGRYPYSNTVYTTVVSYPLNNTARKNLLSGYITVMPVDPINNGSAMLSTGIFNYTYMASDMILGTDSYSLFAQLESSVDPDRCELKRYQAKQPNGLFLDWCDPAISTKPWLQMYEGSIKTAK